MWLSISSLTVTKFRIGAHLTCNQTLTTLYHIASSIRYSVPSTSTVRGIPEILIASRMLSSSSDVSLIKKKI